MHHQERTVEHSRPACGIHWALLTALAWTAVGCRPAEPLTIDEAGLVTEVVARSSHCAACTLDVSFLGTLGSSSDSVLLTSETAISVSRDGAFLAAPTSRDGEGAIYDSLGGAARTYGRFGDGPGENGRILGVLPWRGDTTLFVGFDRLTFLTGPEGHGRTARLERPSPSHRTVALPEVNAVVRNYSYPPERQFLVFDADGGALTQLGSQAQAGVRGDIYEALGELGNAAAPHHFWSSPQRYQIRIDLWDARSGAHVKRLQDTAPWYTPYDSAALYQFMLDGNDSENPPPPFLRGLRESRDAVLWLLYNGPARDWAPIRDTLPPLQRGVRRAAYDGIIDLRDPISGQSILTVWTNLPFARLINDTLLADRRQTEDGFWVYDIYKAVLRR